METMITYSFAIDANNPDYFHEVPCPNCQTYLSIHLPDPDLPHRMLGTCHGCSSWFLIDCNVGKMAQVSGEAFPLAGE